MNKPAVITAFTDDTISIRVAVFDHAGQPVLLADNGLDRAYLFLQDHSSVLGTISSNIVSFKLLPVALEAGKHNFYAKVTGAKSEQYTIAYGQIIVKELPDIS